MQLSRKAEFRNPTNKPCSANLRTNHYTAMVGTVHRDRALSRGKIMFVTRISAVEVKYNHSCSIFSEHVQQ